MSKENTILYYECPQCSRRDGLVVTVLVNRKLVQSSQGNGDYNFETDFADNSDEEWDEESNMMCTHCGLRSESVDFQKHLSPSEIDGRTLTEEEALRELSKRMAAEYMDQDPVSIEQDMATLLFKSFEGSDLQGLEAEFMVRWEEKVRVVP
jgi:hypothetical protein